MENKSSGMEIGDRYSFFLSLSLSLLFPTFPKEKSMDANATCDLHTPIRSKWMDDFILTRWCILCAFIRKICPQGTSHAGLGLVRKALWIYCLLFYLCISLSLTAHSAHLSLLRMEDKRFIFYFYLETIPLQSHTHIKQTHETMNTHPHKLLLILQTKEEKQKKNNNMHTHNMLIISIRVWTGCPYFTAD